MVESDLGEVRAVGRNLTMPTKLLPGVALAMPCIKLFHRDPVDQFLAATARIFGLTLVTADRRLLQESGFSTLAN